MSGPISLGRRVRLGVGAGIGAALLTVAPIASAGGAVAVPLAPSIVELAPDPPHQWSLQNLDGTPATSGQLFDGKLARFKHPKRIVFCDALPKTALGKIQKAGLLARVTAQ